MHHPSDAQCASVDPNSHGASRARWFSLRNWLVLIAIVCMLLGIAFPAIQAAREKTRRMVCADNLCSIGLGLLNYHETYRRFPCAYVLDEHSQRRFGWRVSILPFITSNNVYDRYYAAYRNSKDDFSPAPFYDMDLHFFRCPSDPEQRATTSYYAVTGAATAWPGPSPSCLQSFVRPSKSILIVESSRMDIPWVEPQDLQFDQLDFAIRSRSRMGFSSPRPPTAQVISSEHRSGANVVFADGGVEFLSVDTSPKVIEHMLVISDERPPVRLQPSIRCRLVRDPDSTDLKSPYKKIWYSTDQADEPNR